MSAGPAFLLEMDVEPRAVATAALNILASARKLGEAETHALGQAYLPVLESGNPLTFITKVVEEEGSMFERGTDEEIEAIYSILLSSLRDASGMDAAAVNAVVSKMASGLASVTDARAPLRLRLLSIVYNVAPHKAAKLETFSRIIGYAGATGQLQQLGGVFTGAANWTTKWGLTDAEARPLFLQSYKALSAAGNAEDAQAFLIRYLMTFEKEEHASPAELEASKEHAVAAALGFIRAPAVSQRSNLSHLRVIQALSADPQVAKLHELLNIFSSGSVADFKAFVADAANAAFMAGLGGVSIEQSMETMRLLTLCSLGSAVVGLSASGSAAGAGAGGAAAAAGGKPQVLSYEAVAEALQVPEAEVESWVVRAIARGLLDARMDQMGRTVSVTRSLQRAFGPAQWSVLQAKLRAWRENVSSLLTTVESKA